VVWLPFFALRLCLSASVDYSNKMATPMSSNSAMPSSPSNRLGDSIMDSLALPGYRGSASAAPTSDAPSEARSSQQLFSQSNDGTQSSQQQQRHRVQEQPQPQYGVNGEQPKDLTEKPRRAVDTFQIEPMIDVLGEKAREDFTEFLRTYHEEPLSGSPDPDGDGMHAEPYYLGQIRRLNLGQHRSTTVYVDFSHLLRWNADTAQDIVQNYQQ
jgi:DNA replication licensing factor MCM6